MDEEEKNYKYIRIFLNSSFIFILWLLLYFSGSLFTQTRENIKVFNMQGEVSLMVKQGGRNSGGDFIIIENSEKRIIAKCILSDNIKKICSKKYYNRTLIGKNIEFISIYKNSRGVYRGIIKSGEILFQQERYEINIDSEDISNYFLKLYLFEICFYFVGAINVLVIFYYFYKSLKFLIK